MSSFFSNGQTKEVDNIYINDNGTWKLVSKTYLLSGGVWKEVVDMVRLAYAKFSSNVAAPISSPYSEEIGSFEVIDLVDNQWYVSDGSLLTTGGGSGTSGQHFKDAVSRSPYTDNITIAVRSKLKLSVGVTYVGPLESGSLATYAGVGVTYFNNEVIPLDDGGASPRNFVTIAHPNRIFCIVELEAGRFCLILTTQTSFNNNYKFGLYARSNTVVEAEDLEVDKLKAGLFTSEYGLATTNLSGVRAQGDIFTHEINALVYFKVTAVGGSGFAEISIRRVDDLNKTLIRISSDGSAQLNEMIEGVETTLVSLIAGSISTNTNVPVSFDSSTIRFVPSPTTGKHGQTSSASIGLNATEGRVERLDTGWGISDIVAWPYEVSPQLSFYGGTTSLDNPPTITPEVFSFFRSTEIDSPLYIN